MSGYTYAQLAIGQSASFTKTISESDVYGFAGITGDLNPAHIDEEYAKSSMFNGRIAHGVLVAGLFSAVLGMKMPGPGTIYLKQELKFMAPVRFNDTITATCTIKEKMEKNRVLLDCVATNQAGTVVLTGEALVMLPK